MSTYDEARLAQLLRRLPPVPGAWVEAAQVLPFLRLDVDEIVLRAEADEAFRAALVADLERALADAGYEPAAPLVNALRERLSP